MSTIEAIIIVIIAIIILPILCQYIQRPSLLYCTYLLVGVTIGGTLGMQTRLMLTEVGKIGFTLLLFLIGLDIELPSVSMIKKAIPFCFYWLIIQTPLIVTASYLAGFDLCFGIIAAAGINACSLSIAFGLLKTQSHLDHYSKSIILVSMVLFELFALFILATSDVICEYGWGKEVLLQGGALIGFIMIIKFFSHTIHHWLSFLLDGNNKWRIHQILLIVFFIAIIGERIGLAAAKTAFFLGLFMSGASEKGLKFEEELKPLAKGILIPIFFLSLGTRIAIENIFSNLFIVGFVISALILAIRFYIFRKTFPIKLPVKCYLLFCPNITMVAVAAEILIHIQIPQKQIDLLLMVGLMLTVGAASLFPIRLEKMRKVFN